MYESVLVPVTAGVGGADDGWCVLCAVPGTPVPALVYRGVALLKASPSPRFSWFSFLKLMSRCENLELVQERLRA